MIGEMKNMTLLNEKLSMLSSVKEDTYEALDALADTIAESLK